MKIRLDHVGYLSADVRCMAAAFTNLGFRVIGPAPLQTDSEAAGDGQVVQQSAHVMFPDNYIELTSVSPYDLGDFPTHHLAPYTGQGEGIRLLLLQTANAEQQRLALEHDGHRATAVQQASRQLIYGPSRNRALANFRWFSLPDDPVPGVLTGYVEHLSRDIVFDPAVMAHPNTINGITALLVRPSVLAPQLPFDPDGKVELRAADTAAIGATSIVGLELCAASLQVCAAALSARGVPFHRAPDATQQRGSLIIKPEFAAGALMHIREAP